MIASLMKQRSAALRPSRNVSSRRLLVESLESRRVFDGGLLMAGGNMVVQSDDDLTLGESMTIDVAYATENIQPTMTATWSLYLDNAVEPDFGIAPGNGFDVIDGEILDEWVASYDTESAAAPVAQQFYSLDTLTVSMQDIYDSLPLSAQTENVPLLLVVKFQAGPDSEVVPIKFRIDASGTTAGQSPIVGAISGPGTAVLGQTVTFDVAMTDADSLATDLEHLWTVQDINTGVTVAGGVIVTGVEQTPSLEFTPTYNGSFSISYSVADELGQQGSAVSIPLVVGNRSLVGNDLFLAASAGGSNVSITTTSGGTAVSIDGESITYTGLENIVVYGQAGTDIVIVGANVTTPVTVFGGAGTDILRGGAGADILVGGDGVDVVIGGAGRDLIVGGDGLDILIGDAADDILIAGYTAHDQNAAAMASILAMWNSSDPVLTRIAAIEACWLNGSTVFDDDDMDLLTGNAGFDWFFANLALDGQGDRRDMILDRTAAEFQQYNELINEG